MFKKLLIFVLFPWISFAGGTDQDFTLFRNKELQFREASANGTNKVSLKGPASIGTDRIITVPEPAAADTMCLIAEQQNLTNKRIEDSSVDFVDNNDDTKIFKFDLSSATTSTTTTIQSFQTANRTLTLPDATDTLMGKATTDTMTNKTFDVDGAGNSLSNVVDANIKAAAAIARSKLANGTASHVIINDGGGAFSSEAQLAGTRGGSGISNSGTFTWGSNNITLTTSGVTTITTPTSGTLATLAGTEVLTAKDIDGGTASNTSRITIPKGTTGGIGGLTRKEATLLYDTTLSALFIDNGSALVELAMTSTSAGGSDTQVQYNSSSALAGDAGMTYDDVNNILSIEDVLVSLGTVGAPSISFTGDNDTGIFSSGANILDFSILGIRTGSFGTLGVSVILGGANAPSYSFFGDNDTGMYSSGSNVINFATSWVLILMEP